MRRLRTASLLAGLVTLALAGAGCKQGIGDRCEQNSDCSDGLLCDYGGMTTAEAGRCFDPNGGTDAATQDVATTNDAEDTAPDQADDTSSADAPDDVPSGLDAADGGIPDDGGADGATPDASVD